MKTMLKRIELASLTLSQSQLDEMDGPMVHLPSSNRMNNFQSLKSKTKSSGGQNYNDENLEFKS
jgi:hypothetical protein